ncbi:MAG: helix-turn-helix transcriptional regulator [Peptoniphilaceae bacterium]
MKENRRLEILLDLFKEDFISSKDFCEKLKVSNRTLCRDIDDLKEMGIPIIGKPGVNGGYYLEEKFKKGNIQKSIYSQKELIENLVGDNVLAEEQVEYIVDSLKGIKTETFSKSIDFQFTDRKKNMILREIYLCVLNKTPITLSREGLKVSGIPEKLNFKDNSVEVYIKGNAVSITGDLQIRKNRLG